MKDEIQIGDLVIKQLTKIGALEGRDPSSYYGVGLVLDILPICDYYIDSSGALLADAQVYWFRLGRTGGHHFDYLSKLELANE